MLKVFIDAEYVIQSVHSIANKPKGIQITKENFDWNNFVDLIINGKQVNSVNYYTARLNEAERKDTYDEQTEFLNAVETSLSKYNIQLCLGKMIKTRSKQQATWNEYRKNRVKCESVFSWVQKGVDTQIVLDLCRFAASADKLEENTAILVSGDEDFAETLKYLDEENIKTSLISFNRKDSRISETLKNSPSDLMLLSYTELHQHGII